MTTLIITRGYPGSGKSTKARKFIAGKPNWTRVNRDDLRFSMFEKYADLTSLEEDIVTIAQTSAVKALLEARVNVIVDDTNLNLRTARMWQSIAHNAGADFEVHDITTSAEECIQRDLERRHNGERWVGEHVICRFGELYPMPWPEL